MFGYTVLHIENISAGRQRDAILSVLIRSHARDLLFPVLPQDDQGIFSIGFRIGLRRPFRRVVIGKLNFLERNNFRAFSDEALRRCVNRCSAKEN
jgi:hypothetical protein